MVVENGGLHPAQEKLGSIALVKGYHLIKVDFWAANSGEVAVYFWPRH